MTQKNVGKKWNEVKMRENGAKASDALNGWKWIFISNNGNSNEQNMKNDMPSLRFLFLFYFVRVMTFRYYIFLLCSASVSSFCATFFRFDFSPHFRFCFFSFRKIHVSNENCCRHMRLCLMSGWTDTHFQSPTIIVSVVRFNRKWNHFMVYSMENYISRLPFLIRKLKIPTVALIVRWIKKR